MTDLSKHVANLTKSTENIQRATNAAQREAAKSFLVKRGNELRDELQMVAAWLDEADRYISKEMPEINTDPDAEYMVQWFATLREYEVAQKALDSAWSAYMETLEAA